MKLVVRSDFDGLVCAAMLKKIKEITELYFAHPQDVLDGKKLITREHILCNLPYDPACRLWFGNQTSEKDRIHPDHKFDGAFDLVPSVSRVIFDHYGGQKLGFFDEFVKLADKLGTASFSEEEVINPTGWILLAFLVDPRTGLGRYRNFRISNYDFMQKMVQWITKYSIEEILSFQDVSDRVNLYREHLGPYQDFLKKHSKMLRNTVISDFRGIDIIPVGNRFVVYQIFPQAKVSLRVFDGRDKENVVVAVGHSIFNKTCGVDIGHLMSRYGGGGHLRSGTCQLSGDMVNKQIQEISSFLNLER